MGVEDPPDDASLLRVIEPDCDGSEGAGTILWNSDRDLRVLKAAGDDPRARDLLHHRPQGIAREGESICLPRAHPLDGLSQ